MDAIVHVVRCFEDENIVHVDGSVDPARDVETIGIELIFADLETAEKRIDRTRKAAKGDKQLMGEVELLERAKAHLEAGKPIRTMQADEKEKEMLRGMFLLTTKPVIYAANISENDIGKADNALVDALKKAVANENAEVITICAQVEEEIAELSPEEKQAFIEELGIGESGLDKLVKACYKLLGLISYLTAGPKEVRAWTIERGTKAPQAAGKIHTDFERGFIRAEVVPFETLKELGSMTACKEKGLIRSEGKDYVMQDGDVVVFRFNV